MDSVIYPVWKMKKVSGFPVSHSYQVRARENPAAHSLRLGHCPRQVSGDSNSFSQALWGGAAGGRLAALSLTPGPQSVLLRGFCSSRCPASQGSAFQSPVCCSASTFRVTRHCSGALLESRVSHTHPHFQFKAIIQEPLSLRDRKWEGGQEERVQTVHLMMV